jgi:quercetin dioxygenase-like cupin family protein
VRIEAGDGIVVGADGSESPLSAGDYVYVAPEEIHNFANAGERPFEFICIVPVRGEPPLVG